MKFQVFVWMISPNLKKDRSRRNPYKKKPNSGIKRIFELEKKVIKMKFFVVFVSFAIVFCVATSSSPFSAETFSQLTKEIDEIIRNISADVTTALGGEVNDLVMESSPLPGKLHDVIDKLHSMKRSIPSSFKVYTDQILIELKKLEGVLKSGDFLSVHPSIQTIHSFIVVLKTKIQ